MLEKTLVIGGALFVWEKEWGAVLFRGIQISGTNFMDEAYTLYIYLF